MKLENVENWDLKQKVSCLFAWRMKKFPRVVNFFSCADCRKMDRKAKSSKTKISKSLENLDVQSTKCSGGSSEAVKGAFLTFL